FAVGEVCGVIGQNGAGKTTLFDTLSGDRTPSSGAIHFDDRDVTRRSPTWRSRNGIRRTFQRQQTFGWLSVEENLLVALEWRGGGGGLFGDLGHLPARRAQAGDRRPRAAGVSEGCRMARVRVEARGEVPAGPVPMASVGP